ncbi:purine-binding chemotaxis protein CheW [Arboricoccus pini]|uniref:Purine-binding chemotaxis protein CheW n=1 Tax=Arboricoccus pini TaxID=1963835 RepID=A0A212RTW1_9PROT|nr:chemotaxis protein CheW [Arboricoccus pini]SNB76106.1 purine-binding chemotaxis protein CheW [Arboricoccus pini]
MSGRMEQTAGEKVEGMAQLVSMVIAGQRVGLDVARVRDVLGALPMTRVPRSPQEVVGVLNLRGHIVTAIDLAARLGMPAAGARAMSVVVEHENELYAILVDQVDEVVSVATMSEEHDLGLLTSGWRELTAAIFRRTDGLLIELDVARLLKIGGAAA